MQRYPIDWDEPADKVATNANADGMADASMENTDMDMTEDSMQPAAAPVPPAGGGY